MIPEVAVDDCTTYALGLSSLDRSSVAARLAEIGGLEKPTRSETEVFLIETLTNALSEILPGAAWSWGQFHNSGLSPLHAIHRAEDWPCHALYAADLGVDDRVPRNRPEDPPGGLTPRMALARNLLDATEHLLHEVRVLLEAAGVSTYGRRPES